MKIRRLCIPDIEKEKGLVWVEYPVCKDKLGQVQEIVELKITQGVN